MEKVRSVSFYGKNILDGFADFKAFDRLNRKALPKEERIESAELLRFAANETRFSKQRANTLFINFSEGKTIYDGIFPIFKTL